MVTRHGATAWIRSFDPRLPREVHVLQAGLVLNAFGNGAAGPFMLIYLHDVRGIPIGLAALAASISAASGLVAALVAGSVGDRLGLRATLIVGLAVSALAFCLYPLVHEAWHAWTLALLTGAGFGTWFSLQSSLLAALAPPERRHAAFAHQRVAANVGLGLGGLAGGLIAAGSDPAAFTALFVLNAVTFAVYAVFVARVPAPRRPAGTAFAPQASYRDVLRDGVFVRFIALNFVVVAAAIALLTAILPLFSKKVADVGEPAIGVFFLVNSLLIIVAQLPVARAIEGRRRMRGFALMGLLYAVSWLAVEVAGLGFSGTPAALIILAAVAIFSLGECLYSAIQGPLVADLAPGSRLSSYMAVSAFTWQLGFIVGPGLGGAILDTAPSALWPVAAALCLAVAAYSLVLERTLAPEHRLTPRAEAARA